jgi:hypothetical protein
MTHDVTKLPKWAQRRIETLETQLEQVREANRLQVEGETDIWIQDYSRGDRPLPVNSTIRFDLGDDEIDISVRDHSSGRPALYVYVPGSRKYPVYASGSSNTGWIVLLDSR